MKDYSFQLTFSNGHTTRYTCSAISLKEALINAYESYGITSGDIIKIL